MLDLNLIQGEPEKLAEMLKRRQVEQVDSQHLKQLIEKSKRLIGQIQHLQAHRNRKSKEGSILFGKRRTGQGTIGGPGQQRGEEQEMQAGQQREKEQEDWEKSVNSHRAELRSLGEQISQLQTEQRELELELHGIAETLPNWLEGDVPEGDEANNVEIRSGGELPQFSFKPLTHWQIGEQLAILDLERGVRLATSRFYTYSGLLAQLERALINFMLDLHTTHFGYQEIFVPMLVNDACMYVTGQFPKFRNEYYSLEQDSLSLIPTAEVPLVNLHSRQILAEEQLPLAYTAATSCFRREAGAAGRDTRGLVRVHQFQKVELVQFCLPEDSTHLHEEMALHAEEVLHRLKLPFRTVLKAAGDTGVTARKSYDLEVWMPGLERWLEISSISNCGDYQARRGKIRYRGRAPGSRPRFVHTLNGSGVAAGRCMIAIMENYQQKDGQFGIPQALQPYMQRRP